MTGCSKAQYFLAIWQWNPCMSRERVGQAGDLGTRTPSDHKVQVGWKFKIFSSMVNFFFQVPKIACHMMSSPDKVCSQSYVCILQVVYDGPTKWYSVRTLCSSPEWSTHQALSQKIENLPSKFQFHAQQKENFFQEAVSPIMKGKRKGKIRWGNHNQKKISGAKTANGKPIVHKAFPIYSISLKDLRKRIHTLIFILGWETQEQENNVI